MRSGVQGYPPRTESYYLTYAIKQPPDKKARVMLSFQSFLRKK